MTSVLTILHPTDFLSSADKDFQAACSLALDRDAHLILLHVMELVRLSGEWITVELSVARSRSAGKLSADFRRGNRA